MTIELNRLAAEDFDPLVGASLPVQAGDRALALTLAEVWRSPYPTGRELPGFSLFLTGPADAPLGQGMLQLAHPVHGPLDLFATVVGRGKDGWRYEIVFN